MAYEFATVGVGQKEGGVSFWMLEEDMGGKRCELKVSEKYCFKFSLTGF